MPCIHVSKERQIRACRCPRSFQRFKCKKTFEYATTSHHRLPTAPSRCLVLIPQFPCWQYSSSRSGCVAFGGRACDTCHMSLKNNGGGEMKPSFTVPRRGETSSVIPTPHTVILASSLRTTKLSRCSCGEVTVC